MKITPIEDRARTYAAGVMRTGVRGLTYQIVNDLIERAVLYGAEIALDSAARAAEGVDATGDELARVTVNLFRSEVIAAIRELIPAR